MDKKRLSINLVANIVSFGISTLLSFFLTPFLVRYLGKEIYGFYGIANNFVSFITVIAVALNSMAAKYITVELVRGNNIKANQYYASIFISNLILCVLLLPVLTITVFEIDKILTISPKYLIDIQILFSLVFLAMIIRFLTLIFGSATYSSNRMDIRAYIEIAKSFLRLLLYFSIFYFFKPSIIYVGLVLFLLEAFNSGIQISIAKKLLPGMSLGPRWYNRTLVTKTFKVGIWNSINQLGDLLINSTSLIISNIFLGEMASGSVSIVKTMPLLLSGVITAINGVFMPRVAHMYAIKDKSKLILEVINSQKFIGFVLSPISVILVVYGKDFFNLWVPGNNSTLLMQLSIFEILKMVFVGISLPILNLNIVIDKVKVPSIYMLISGFINIIFMVLLLKYTKLQIFSIFLATFLVTFSLYGIIIPNYTSHLFKISPKVFFRVITITIFNISLIFLVTKVIYSFSNITSWGDFLLSTIFSGFIGYMISVLTFFGPKKIKYYVSKVLEQ
ncbi:Polysaccharide biosynthesis protein [Streptococcus porcinus]|uniref:oligosaccharide flippase family protein n=1 Tax=Streptococcus porcinus TaxID=1340 RepID=UPI0010CAAED5|nr:oligosaccharide flippase family protein [Streptococcus porcinus]VTS24377.1 Polysaccharide biosynthesis protein [Streptococcus porcinus]